MSTVQQAIEVRAPLHAVYEQLATFESYPEFMTGVQQVTQTSSDQTHWVMDLDGQRREFDAQIIECSLDERVSWSTMDGPLLAETITLRPMGETRTQVIAQLEADVAVLMPSDRHARASLDKRLKADLAGFKRLIEMDDTAAARQISGSSTIASGQASTGSAMSASVKNLDPSSPMAVAARAARNRAAGMGPSDAAGGMGPSGAVGGMAGGMAAGLQDTMTGGAGMGGQAMSTDDAWGDGMINEEERGSAHDH